MLFFLHLHLGHILREIAKAPVAVLKAAMGVLFAGAGGSGS